MHALLALLCLPRLSLQTTVWVEKNAQLGAARVFVLRLAVIDQARHRAPADGALFTWLDEILAAQWRHSVGSRHEAWLSQIPGLLSLSNERVVVASQVERLGTVSMRRSMLAAHGLA
jgi:hypothetical protein